MNFIPETPKEQPRVPHFEEARQADGWAGHTTTKSLRRLQQEVVEALERLGAGMISFQRGQFDERDGFRITYMLADHKGQLDVAALPVKQKQNEQKREQSLRMALYMVRQALAGSWFLQQLSPGYAPLMPWMIGEGGKTITQLWTEHSAIGNLLPPPEDWIEGTVEAE